MHAYKHNTHIAGCTKPLANHIHRLPFPTTLQTYGWIWIVSAVFNISLFFCSTLHYESENKPLFSHIATNIQQSFLGKRQWIHASQCFIRCTAGSYSYFSPGTYKICETNDERKISKWRRGSAPSARCMNF